MCPTVPSLANIPKKAMLFYEKLFRTAILDYINCAPVCKILRGTKTRMHIKVNYKSKIWALQTKHKVRVKNMKHSQVVPEFCGTPYLAELTTLLFFIT